MFEAYLIGLFTVAPLAAVLGGPSILMVAGVIFYNWTLNTILVLALNDQTPWQAFAAIDGLSLAALLWWARRQDECLPYIIAFTYAGQLSAHFLFELSGEAAAYAYWQALTVIAFLQLAILVVALLERGMNPNP